jgi:hypothetical protein
MTIYSDSGCFSEMNNSVQLFTHLRKEIKMLLSKVMKLVNSTRCDPSVTNLELNMIRKKCIKM